MKLMLHNCNESQPAEERLIIREVIVKLRMKKNIREEIKTQTLTKLISFSMLM